MVDPSNVRLVGTLAPYRDGLWAELLALGYTPLSGMSLVRLMSSLSRWLEGKGLEAKELDSRRIEEFLKHRRASGCTCWLSLQGLDPILGHLRRIEAVPPAEPRVAESTPLAVFLDEYGEYLLRERGLKQSSSCLASRKGLSLTSCWGRSPKAPLPGCVSSTRPMRNVPPGTLTNTMPVCRWRYSL